MHYEGNIIRPPSEAGSLLIRITRNCPWNKCKFCGLYRGETFSIRPVEHVMRDIDQVRLYADRIEDLMEQPAGAGYRQIAELQHDLSPAEQMAFHSALNWVRNGMRSVFLQDANTLVVKPAELTPLCALALAELPLAIRGFGPVKEANLAAAAEKRRQILEQLTES